MGKLDLDKLKVQSFVTSLDEEKNQTIKGGDESPHITADGGEGCVSAIDTCPHRTYDYEGC